MELLKLIGGVLAVILFSYGIYYLTTDRPTKAPRDTYDAQKNLGI